MSRHVLVTGSSGFVGSALLKRLENLQGIQAIAGVRRVPAASTDTQRTYMYLGDLETCQVSPSQLSGVSTVVHTAARVHVMHERAKDPLAEFRRVNVVGTLALARAAAEAGVRRFIFISSIKVNGEFSLPGSPFTADMSPAPVDPYGVSKFEAEQGLWQIARETDMDVVIVRPPLVYGPGVRANFLSMMKWLNKGLPLPLAGIDNRRSLVALDNLIDLLICCIELPEAAGQVFLVSDGEDLSTSELLSELGTALRMPARLWAWATPMLRELLRLTRRDALSQRLFGSLQVDIGKTRQMLGWVPPVPVRAALQQTAEDFLRRTSC